MQTKKFWCHYIGNDGNTPKRRSIELTDIHELLPNVSNDGAKTPLWYEKKEDDYRQVYYELYAQLSDIVAVNIIHMNLRPYAVERLLQSDEDIVSRHEKRLENFLAEYPKLSEERKKQDRENCEHQIAADKHERDRNMLRIKKLMDYSNLLLTGTLWVCSATVRAYKEAGSGYYPLLEILRNENLAEREREEQERRKEDRRRAEEEARKKAEAEAREQERLTKEQEKFKSGGSIAGSDVVELCRRHNISVHLRTVHNLQQVIANINGKEGTCQYYRTRGKRRPQLDGCYKTATELYNYLQTA